MREGLETIGYEYQGLAGAGSARRLGPGFGRGRARASLGEASITLVEGGLFSCSDLVPSQHPPIRSQILPAQPGPADGHVHVLGLCPDWMALLTGCGLWSPRAGSGGSSVLIQPVLDYPGKAASVTATAAREVQWGSAPALSSQWASGRGRGMQGSPSEPPIVLVAGQASAGTACVLCWSDGGKRLWSDWRTCVCSCFQVLSTSS